MANDGTLYLVDPFHRSRMKWINSVRRAARVAVTRSQRANVVWIEKFSLDAVWYLEPVTGVNTEGFATSGSGQTGLGNLPDAAGQDNQVTLRAQFQLHRNIKLLPAEQAPADHIANSGTTDECKGVYIKASVAPDGKSYTVQIGPDGKVHTFDVRAKPAV